MLQQTRKRKKFFYPQVTARNIALHSLMPYIGSSLKKVTSLFQIRLFPYKRVKFTKFSPKKVCQVRKKEFPCFMLITVISSSLLKAAHTMLLVVKTVFILLASPNYIQVIELRFGLIAEVKPSSKLKWLWLEQKNLRRASFMLITPWKSTSLQCD